MNAVRVTQYIVLLVATALLGYAVSGASQGALLFVGYLILGVSGAGFLLHRGQENLSVVVWGLAMLLVAFVFDSDHMLGADYQPTSIGLAMLVAVPVIAALLRFAYWVIDRLRLQTGGTAAARRGGRGGKAGTGPGFNGKANHPAYPWLISCWLLWPVGIAAFIMLDDNRWDRMRYDNSLLFWMFLPPIVATIGFLIYRHWRERKNELETAAQAQKTSPQP